MLISIVCNLHVKGQCEVEENRTTKKIDQASDKDFSSAMVEIESLLLKDNSANAVSHALEFILFNKQKIYSKYSNRENIIKWIELVEEECGASAEMLLLQTELYFSIKKYEKCKSIVQSSELLRANYPTESNYLLQLAKARLELFGKPHKGFKEIKSLNTNYNEFLPFLSGDNQNIYFTREEVKKDRGVIGVKKKEVFMSAKRLDMKDFKFSEAEDLRFPFNEKGKNYGAMTTSLQSDQIIVTVCEQLETGYKNCDLFETHIVGDDSLGWIWSNLELLPNTINGDTTWESQPSLSADGSTLIFAKFNNDLLGTEIYQSVKDENGEWQQAQKIDVLNTEFNDKAPFLHPDGNHLYFSSDRPYSVGGYDLFVSEKGNDGNWGVPKNLGSSVNTAEDEHGVQIITDGKYRLIASTITTQGYYDIYYFDLPKEMQPEALQVFSGEANAFNQSDSIAIELRGRNGELLNRSNASKRNGRFVSLVKMEKAGDVQNIVAKSYGEKKSFSSVSAGMTNSTGFKLLNNALSNESFELEGINFDFDKSTLKPESERILKAFADYLNEIEFKMVTLIGHTDNQGDEAYNKKLSLERAEVVKSTLVELGVPVSKLKCEGKGSSVAIASNSSETGRAKNRRTEVKIES